MITNTILKHVPELTLDFLLVSLILETNLFKIMVVVTVEATMGPVVVHTNHLSFNQMEEALNIKLCI